MVSRKSCEEFRETGLLLYINQVLHAFGWSIVVDTETNTMYPARVKFRGFSEDVVEDSYKKIGQYLKDNTEELYKESQE